MSLIPSSSARTYANQASSWAQYDRTVCTGQRKCKCPKCHPKCNVWCNHLGAKP